MKKSKAAVLRRTQIAIVAAAIVATASPAFAQYYGPYAGPIAPYNPYGAYGGYGAYGQVGVNAPYYFAPTGYFASFGEYYTRYTLPAELTHWFERNPPYFNN
jgi:hypothetical protein